MMSVARLTLENECFKDIVKLEKSLELDCMPEEFMTLESQTKLCKALSREGCCTYQFGASIGKEFPFKLFVLLDDRV